MGLADKVVLITGASRGIGAAVATAFAREGAAVSINYLSNHEAANRVAQQCAALGGTAECIAADVTDAGAVTRLVAETIETFGTIDVLVNNAFRQYAFDPEQRKLFWDMPWADYENQFEGAVRSTYHLCQAALPAMKARTAGSIINVATDLIARPSVPYHDYTTAKAALVGFSRNLAAELGPFGIRVNCVAPGLIYPTDASRATKESVKDAIISQTPLRRLGQPEDIAGPVLFLASEWSRFMTGQVLTVDGGLVMG
ncbi:MAG: 3-oxoacyl-ACP reductase [Pseudomonadota bacterium]